MQEYVLLGKGKNIHRIERSKWEAHLHPSKEHLHDRFGFMTYTHHRVRNYIVRTLPIFGKPIPPESISSDLNLSIQNVKNTLRDLELNLFFLNRNMKDEVCWAYPVTVEPTPHQLTFDTGSLCFAA